MIQKQGYKAYPFSSRRKIVAKTLSVARNQNNIHIFQEVDISIPRKMIADHKKNTGESVSLTAYIVHCLGKTFVEFPQMNAIRKGRNLIVPDDVTVGVLIEREIEDEVVPENYGIHKAQSKSYREINDEIRTVQNRNDELWQPFRSVLGEIYPQPPFPNLC